MPPPSHHPPHRPATPCVHRPRARGDRPGFPLLEAMVAAVVLVHGITTAITTLRRGLPPAETARHDSLAAHVMQCEHERLRL